MAEEKLHEVAIRKESLTDKAKEIMHEVAEKTMELAHEVKDKITGHVTDKDVANAVQKISDLKTKLANEQHQLDEIQLAANAAEKILELHEYEALKAKEVKAVKQERELQREIAAAEGEYIRLQSVQLTQKHAQKSKS